MTPSFLACRLDGWLSCHSLRQTNPLALHTKYRVHLNTSQYMHCFHLSAPTIFSFLDFCNSILTGLLASAQALCSLLPSQRLEIFSKYKSNHATSLLRHLQWLFITLEQKSNQNKNPILLIVAYKHIYDLTPGYLFDTIS